MNDFNYDNQLADEDDYNNDCSRYDRERQEELTREDLAEEY